MIERTVEGDALDAREDMLLVPMPINDATVHEGFARQVLNRYPITQRLVDAKQGLSAGEFMMVGTKAGDPSWRPSYTLVLAALHRREVYGWQLADTFLSDIMHRIHQIYAPNRMATAGIPGSGYSGLPGDAHPERMRGVLEDSPLMISIYQRGPSGDRAKLLEADPPNQDRVEAPLPKTPFAEQYMQRERV
jgi:hypothetical protein